MIKVNVRCVTPVRRLHELAVQSVKIVELEDTVTGVKNANLVNIVPLRLMILRYVLTAFLEDTNLTLGKQAVFRVRQESIATWKGFQNVLIV